MVKGKCRGLFCFDKSFNPLLVLLLIVSAFIIGMFWTKVQYLEKSQENTQVAAVPTQTQPNQEVAGTKTVKVDPGHFPPLGNKQAKVTIIEFADFQCPFCEKFFKDAVSAIKKGYIDTGKAKFYFRNYGFLGQESTWAAEAVECANEQGKFWEMHNYLFENQKGENQGAFSKENLKMFAQNIGLDGGKFNSCVDTEKYKASVEKDLSDGKAAGVQGTPGTFINGRLVVGAQPFDNFKVIIDEELNKK